MTWWWACGGVIAVSLIIGVLQWSLYLVRREEAEEAQWRRIRGWGSLECGSLEWWEDDVE